MSKSFIDADVAMLKELAKPAPDVTLPASEEVRRLEVLAHRLKMLCGEMLALMIAPKNVEQFREAKMDELADWGLRWERIYTELVKDGPERTA